MPRLQHTVHVAAQPEGFDQAKRSFEEARRDVRALHAAARRANRSLARLESDLASLGIKFTIQGDER